MSSERILKQKPKKKKKNRTSVRIRTIFRRRRRRVRRRRCRRVRIAAAASWASATPASTCSWKRRKSPHFPSKSPKKRKTRRTRPKAIPGFVAVPIAPTKIEFISRYSVELTLKPLESTSISASK